MATTPCSSDVVTSPRPTVVISVLASCGLAVSLMQTLVVPLLPQFPQLLSSSPSTVAWLVTATLVAAAVCAPVMGRLGDMYGKRRILLAGLAMTQWPYTHVCGLKSMFYLVGAGAVVAAGVWGAWGSWRRRMGLAHGLSVGVLIWGLALVTFEVLPKIGYAAKAATWFCPEPPAAP